MILALDVAYAETQGYAVAVAFPTWDAAAVAASYAATVSPIAEYEPGAFYKRELPCLLAVLAQIDLATVSCVVVDGYVTLGAEARAGLGQHLYEALGSRLPVVGVAKTRFAGVAPQVAAVLRGQSQSPLYVTSVGLPVAEAARLVATMHGDYRFPTLLKVLDDLTKRTR
ncbi:endonuclease V [Hymenobacter sp. H14-R3]|uniref:endonuclease V n=1 Tax=Hymenobacter sp. H14-R3 TaxID=3046308 RepID=UPI0024BA9BCA|nr:endonuclease V [Hymenobacter sp. H14-R3]MDJ0365944.1 endonuclease V [Hymenobacter sp. H14-R3]